MGSLYRLGQKFVDFCNVVQQNINNALTVPSSAVVYDLTTVPWGTERFSSSCNASVLPPRAGLYLCEIQANPASSSASLNVSISYNGSTVVQRSSVGNGTAYSGISASAIINVTDTTIPIIFTATNATATTSWNRYNILWMGNAGNRFAG